MKEKYWNISVKLANQLDSTIEQLVVKVKSSNKFNNNREQIIVYLKNLQWDSNQLRNLKNNNYRSKAEIKAYLLQLIKNIKTNITALKRLL
jgi:hypothetical protein